MNLLNLDRTQMINKALDMAIEALEQTELNSSYNSIKTELKPCEDCISREQTLKAFAEKCGGECACCKYNGSGYDNAENCKLIKSIPSVTPTRPKGKWIEQTDKNKKLYGWFYCSECGAVLGRVDGANYCSECGAEMEGSNE